MRDRPVPVAPRRRRALIGALVLPVAITLALSAARSLRPGTVVESPCWILPNLRSLEVPGEPGCPIGTGDALRRARTGDRIEPVASLAALDDLLARSDRALTVILERDGHLLSAELPVRSVGRAARVGRWVAAALAAALLLAVPLSLLRRSSAPAALPLALFYSAFSVASVAVIAGRASSGASLAALAALAIAPSSLFHLALCFPRECSVKREAPVVVAVPYLAGALLLCFGSVALWRTPALWPAFLYLLVGVCGGAWMVLICSCFFATVESRAALDRARGRLVLFGSLLLPTLPTLLVALESRASAREIPVLYLWSAAATMPLPIALAVSRYNLFDLELDARHGIARTLYLAAAALVVAAGAWAASLVFDTRDALPGAASLLAVSFVCVLLLEPLRTRMPHRLESLLVPRVQHLRAVGTALEDRLSGLRDEDEIAGCVEDALALGLRCRSGAIFLHGTGRARLGHAFGPDPPSQRRLAEAARAALGGDRVLHLATLAEAPPALDALLEAQVVLAVSIEGGGEALGLLLAGAPEMRPFYTGLELDFARWVAGVVGAALHRARAHARRDVKEREAVAGRVALALAHDTGKDISWLRMLATRLAAAPGASRRARDDAATIAELSEELVATFHRVLEEASTAAGAGEDLPRFDDIVERTLRRLCSLHGGGRIVDVVDPALRGVRLPEPVGRVLGNVLDNALHASPRDAPVHLFATLEGSRVRLVVEDRGCGIPAELRERVFEPGVSTRRLRRGSGMGLTVARDIAEMLGGSIALESRDGGGTTATIRLERPSGAAAESRSR